MTHPAHLAAAAQSAPSGERGELINEGMFPVSAQAHGIDRIEVERPLMEVGREDKEHLLGAACCVYTTPDGSVRITYPQVTGKYLIA
jgi:predicted RecA/RadA family phage recombinase